ncbi:MAG: selenoneine synthase SenA [Betaproteobacteria bacterium]
MLSADLLASRSHHAKVTRGFEDERHGERLLGPKLGIVNPPLWEIGHVGWFQERWCLRSRDDGSLADSILPGADALYDSSSVPHATRWGLPLPGLAATRRYLDDVLALVLARIEREPQSERLAYFVRLATLHEDMHSEAFHYTHQTHGYAAPFDARAEAAGCDLPFSGGILTLGAERNHAGFIFDNEKWAHRVEVRPFSISSTPVSNAQFLEYVEAGGAAPRYWRKSGLQRGDWEERRFERWMALDPAAPARHVDWNEAQGWCRWARRRLPSEAEWEFAARSGNPAFRWGDVWEWTSSPFEPFAGFSADPYTDYSQPWFGTHKVLKGASFATPRRLVRPAFRNFYMPERGDAFCGLRTCTIEL